MTATKDFESLLQEEDGGDAEHQGQGRASKVAKVTVAVGAALLLAFAAPSMMPAGKPANKKLAVTVLQEEQSPSQLIDEIFDAEGVKDLPGKHVSFDFSSMNAASAHAAFRKCSSVDWSKVSGSDSSTMTPVQDQLAELGILDKCPQDAEKKYQGDEATCKAVFAAIAATSKLNQKFPQGPVMLHYMKSNLPGQTFPSWGTSEDQNNVKANTGFGVCDIIRTVLNKVNRQAGSQTCGPTSVLADLIVRAPAQAIKTAMKVMWEGKIPGYPAGPCSDIYSMEPGLIAAAGHKDCTSADCKASAGEGFPAGIQGAWTQIAISSYNRQLNSGYYPEEEVCQHDLTLKFACDPADTCKLDGGAVSCTGCGIDALGDVKAAMTAMEANKAPHVIPVGQLRSLAHRLLL